LLIEVYRTPDATVAHNGNVHYASGVMPCATDGRAARRRHLGRRVARRRGLVMRFEFANGHRDRLRAGVARDLATRLPMLGRRLFVIGGRDASRNERITSIRSRPGS
jgi:hypothetical protein